MQQTPQAPQQSLQDLRQVLTDAQLPAAMLPLTPWPAATQMQRQQQDRRLM